MTELAELLEVVPGHHGKFQGRCLMGARGRMFGGQTAAQALRAATLVTADDRTVQSVHTFFLRPGDPARPVDYTVTPLKNGRSFTTVRVDAVQGERLILTATASFHTGESSAGYQASAPAAPEPHLCSGQDYVPPGTNPQVRRPVEFRYPDPASTSEDPAPPAQVTWLRSRTALGEKPALHACAVTYASDLLLPRTAHMPLRRPGVARLGSSLDHSLWFHRPFRADDWLLFDQRTTSYADGRALSHGSLFTPQGELVASVTQESLIRVRQLDAPT